MKIVGLEAVKNEMNKIISQADAYRKGGAKVPHMVINLTKDNGQSYVAAYIASVLYGYKLRKFCGLDMILEYRPDGTLKNVRQVFEDIIGNAVYTNEFEGVVAIDVSQFFEYVNEYQMDFFVEQISIVAKSATVIIYYNDNLGRRMEVVKRRICDALGNYIMIQVEAYSTEEFYEIVVDNIKKRGIIIESEDTLKKIIYDVMDKRHIANVKEAVTLAENLAFCTDYSGCVPRIDISKACNFFFK
mgnify:CR=1 FL=1